jgi:AcrR family transcriptional regulator
MAGRARAAAAAGAEGTRELILAGAARLFRQQGYAATTLRQIAEAAGIKAGSIYYHFGSKDEILGVVLDEGIRAVEAAVRDRLSRLAPDASHRERVAAAIAGHLHGLLQRGDFTSANIRIYGQIPASLKARHRLLRQAYARFWDDLLARAREAGELRGDVSLAMLRLFLIGALNWTVEWYNPRRGSFDEFARGVTAIVFEGILDPGRPIRERAGAGRPARPTRRRMPGT